MIFKKEKAPDFNWVTLRAGGAEVRAKKHGFKATRATQKIMRYGSNKAVARTIGTSNVDDTAIEFDWIGAISFLNAMGVTDYNLVPVKLAGKTFEMTEDIRDPETNPLRSAGGFVNIAKGCEIIGVEWNSEAGENASPLTITVSILDLDIAKGDLGGAGMNLGT
jgi:hypothetical protein